MPLANVFPHLAKDHTHDQVESTHHHGSGRQKYARKCCDRELFFIHEHILDMVESERPHQNN